ncbi:histidine kinase [Terrimonas pollutisoli]|uniref:histidine kinase n=1 Tax=Terrimonas pollutisoli TaxID=3034147 RepID=UPI0023EC47C5|nr:histidine kinase [Terrimonas sp. H1YJ31]
MRSFLLFIFFLATQPLPAQTVSLELYGQPKLKQGISIVPYALVYEDPSGDTTQPLNEVMKQSFIPAASSPVTKFHNNRQMKRTSQVVWLQFKITNTHLADTIHLWYDCGPHAIASLYAEANGGLIYLESSGLCTPVKDQLTIFGMPLVLPPHTTHHYFVRIADYIVLMSSVAGTIHTTETYQAAWLTDNSNNKWVFFLMPMLIGCLLLMSLYTFFQYILNRDKAFLFYGLYAALAFCWMMEFANPRFHLGFVPSFMPWLGHAVSFSFTYILSILHVLFLSKLLSIPAQQPGIWRVARPLLFLLAFLQVMMVIQLFTGILIKSNAWYWIIDGLPGVLMGLLMVIATIRSKSKLKIYLLTGEIILYFYVIALSPLLGYLTRFDLSPQLLAFVNNVPFFIALGLFSELFCFLLALAKRNKLIETEKNHLQQNYTNQLETELTKRTHEIEQQSRQLEKQHADQLQLSFEQKLSEIEMSALRAQMNPHFIFNCLNSIKLYTTDNESAKAADYLTKFSRLIRLVLENSRSEKVTLKNELEALSLYMEMETMRFKSKLNFTIETDPALDTDLVEMPPLLLQPYVENAIWHGLMHKREGGSVYVKIKQLKSERLQITITDDGIGRARAAELKSKSAIAGKSFGMKVTGERIALINHLYKTNAKVQVNDLTDAEGNAAGTEVVIEILI